MTEKTTLEGLTEEQIREYALNFLKMKRFIKEERELCWTEYFEFRDRYLKMCVVCEENPDDIEAHRELEYMSGMMSAKFKDQNMYRYCEGVIESAGYYA